MPAYTGPDRYCRVCNALLSHLESGVCLVHERTSRRTPDDAVMRAEEELREAERRGREGR